MNTLIPPPGFQFNHGDSIHTSMDTHPHLTGTMNGQTVHVPYYGQTTLGMFDRNLPGHRLDDISNLHQQNPSVFKDSGLNW